MNDGQDGAATEPQSTFRLIYRSHSLVSAEESKAVLGEIFTTARRKNRRLGVTGALMISGDAFVQALEGEEQVVRELYATISQDARHDEVNVIEEQSIDEPTFGRWAMAKVASDGGADIRLMSNASRGVIVAAPGTDSTITPEQEAVLTSMRSSLAVQSA